MSEYIRIFHLLLLLIVIHHCWCRSEKQIGAKVQNPLGEEIIFDKRTEYQSEMVNSNGDSIPFEELFKEWERHQLENRMKKMMDYKNTPISTFRPNITLNDDGKRIHETTTTTTIEVANSGSLQMPDSKLSLSIMVVVTQLYSYFFQK